MSRSSNKQTLSCKRHILVPKPLGKNGYLDDWERGERITLRQKSGMQFVSTKPRWNWISILWLVLVSLNLKAVPHPQTAVVFIAAAAAVIIIIIIIVVFIITITIVRRFQINNSRKRLSSSSCMSVCMEQLDSQRLPRKFVFGAVINICRHNPPLAKIEQNKQKLYIQTY